VGGSVAALAFSASNQLAGAGTGDILVWSVGPDAQPGTPPRRFARSEKSPITTLTFDRAADRLVQGTRDGTVVLWDVKTGESIGAPLNGHAAAISSLAFSGDGQFLATGSADETTIIWDVASGAQIGIPLPSGPPDAIEFDEDNTQVNTTSGATRTTWPIDLRWEQAQARACVVAHRNLGSKEWADFEIPGEPEPICPAFPMAPS